MRRKNKWADLELEAEAAVEDTAVEALIEEVSAAEVLEEVRQDLRVAQDR